MCVCVCVCVRPLFITNHNPSATLFTSFYNFSIHESYHFSPLSSNDFDPQSLILKSCLQF